MADFNIAYAITHGHEGGYANDPDDYGEETYRGISSRYWPTWEGWAVIDSHRNEPGFPKNLDRDERLQGMVQAFYQKEFWNAIFLDQFDSQAIANELFDTGVNAGTGTAVRMLQEALNLLNRNGRDYADLAVDGKIGAKTMFAARLVNEAKLFNTLNILQGEKYIESCRRNPRQEKFFHGWLNRVELMRNTTKT